MASFGYSLKKCTSHYDSDSGSGAAKLDDSLSVAFGLPSSPPSPSTLAGVDASTLHPLQINLNKPSLADYQMNLNMLRDIQGIHAPLRLLMERKAFEKTGRLAFLPSSNLSTDVLSGNDDFINFSDILYTSDVYESQYHPYDDFIRRRRNA